MPVYFLKAFVTTALTVWLPRSMPVYFLEASSTLVSLTFVKLTNPSNGATISFENTGGKILNRITFENIQDPFGDEVNVFKDTDALNILQWVLLSTAGKIYTYKVGPNEVDVQDKRIVINDNTLNWEYETFGNKQTEGTFINF